jgi:hypothetical protein
MLQCTGKEPIRICQAQPRFEIFQIESFKMKQFLVWDMMLHVPDKEGSQKFNSDVVYSQSDEIMNGFRPAEEFFLPSYIDLQHPYNDRSCAP